MIFDWKADPTPGEVDDPPAEGEIEAESVEAALAALTETYPGGEWSVLVVPRSSPRPAGVPANG